MFLFSSKLYSPFELDATNMFEMLTNNKLGSQIHLYYVALYDYIYEYIYEFITLWKIQVKIWTIWK